MEPNLCPGCESRDELNQSLSKRIDELERKMSLTKTQLEQQRDAEIARITADYAEKIAQAEGKLKAGDVFYWANVSGSTVGSLYTPSLALHQRFIASGNVFCTREPAERLATELYAAIPMLKARAEVKHIARENGIEFWETMKVWKDNWTVYWDHIKGQVESTYRINNDFSSFIYATESNINRLIALCEPELWRVAITGK